MVRVVVASFKYLAIVLLSIAIFAVGYNYLFRTEEVHFSSELGKEKGLESKMYGTVITEKNSKGEVLMLLAKESLVGDTVIEMKMLNLLFHPNGKKPLSLTANQGLLDNNSDDAVFTGDVQVSSKRPFILLTDRLDWVAAERMLKTDKKVRMKSDEGVITGRGLLLNVDTQDVVILNDLNAKMEKRVVTGNRGEFLSADKKMKVYGNAKMVQKEVDSGEDGINTLNVEANQLEALSESEGADYEIMVARGNVIITTEKRKITGDLARLYTPESEIVVTGNAILKEGGDDLRGEKIIYFYDRDDIIVSGGRDKNKRARMLIAPLKSD